MYEGGVVVEVHQQDRNSENNQTNEESLVTFYIHHSMKKLRHRATTENSRLVEN